MASVESVRKHLQEILGTEGRDIFSDELIRRHLQNYQGRVDAIQCALESLCEFYYEESNRFLNDHLPTFALSQSQAQRGPIEFFQNPFKRKKVSFFHFSPPYSKRLIYLNYVYLQSTEQGNTISN